MTELDPLVWAGVAVLIAWAVALAIYLVAHNISMAPRRPKIPVTAERRYMFIREDRSR